MRIMIIDDERPVRQYIAKLVSDSRPDAEVIEERSAVHALESIKEIKPDLIFLDITMPQMDGLAALEKIRREDRNTKVIMLTCHDSFEYARTALKLEALDYVLKDELNYEVIGGLLEKAESAGRRPDEDGEECLSGCESSKLISRAVEFISKNYMSDINLSVMSKELYVNSDYFCKKFKKVTGINFTEYLKHVRLKEARKLLLTTNLSITEISNNVGFRNDSYFSHTFKKVYGHTPNDLRKNQRKESQ